MKITFDRFSGFNIAPENAQDIIFLEEMIKQIDVIYRPFLSNFFKVYMREMPEEGTQETTLEDAVCTEKSGKEFVGDEIESISFSPMNTYTGEGIKERVKELAINIGLIKKK